ncbi:short-chain dehydrogenase [Pandoraea cepalis]|uniref:Short-chain dehydrogenase n=1 Tax=Pandoraea cepalis TaxID=2508294 RepID=A0AAW7MTC3_9BURK|nr:SDR family oxidoreductase [Pandoraea cepalis]MDN4575870.1 short-chain dehydrogenase [Pandoraea cepalis]MDN4580972.1 short-chain dehydrogenase [Pandoraea cepalis]
MATHTTSPKVFITGASSGLGEALARHYAAQGAILGLVGRRGDRLADLAASLPHPHAVHSYALDVRDALALRAAADDFMARHGVPDIVIANAGISHGVTTEDPADLPHFASVMDTNWLAMVATFSPFVAPMRERKHGTLVGIGSVAGVRGLPGHGAYSASKAAAMTYLESLRVELRAAKVAVVTIAPGYIRTPMTDGNPFPMPFLMPPDTFARKAAAAIARRKRFVVLPWPMGVVACVMRCLPRWLYDVLFARAPRKPRLSERDVQNAPSANTGQPPDGPSTGPK